MAEENLELDVQSIQKKSRLRLVLIIVGVLVILGGGGFGAYMFLSASDSETASQSPSSASADLPKPKRSEGQYVGMPRAFLFNLPGPSRNYLVQIKVQLQVRSDAAEDTVKRHIPIVEDALLSTFSTADANQLKRKEGKEALRVEALLNVQNALRTLTGEPHIERVLFTGFVMQ